jgi:hypothetical protein
VFKKISNMTKFYCPNKPIYYFFKVNTKISTSFRQSMLISFWIDMISANSNVATSPVFDGLFHVIKSLIILIASFVKGYIMMLKLHEWSQEIWSKNVIFKCKNYVPHLLFHVQIVFFRNSFFRHLNKALII